MAAFEIAALSALEILDSRGRPPWRSRYGWATALKPAPGCHRAPRPAPVRRWNGATETRPASAGAACSALWPPSTPNSLTCSAGGLALSRSGRPGDDRPRRYPHQEQARRQRDRGCLHGARPRPRRFAPGPAVALADPRRRDPVPAGAAFQRAQRRGARTQRAGLPGIHDRTTRRPLDGRGGPRGRRGICGTAPRAGRCASCPPAWATRAVSPPRSTDPEDVLRLLVKAISDAGYRPGRMGCRSPSTRPRRSSVSLMARYRVAGDLLTSAEMIQRYARIVAVFPCTASKTAWAKTTTRAGSPSPRAWAGRFSSWATTTSSPTRHLHRAIKRASPMRSLIKLNQIGTVTEPWRLWPSAARPATAPWSPTARARPRTPSSPTLPSARPRPAQAGAPVRGERVAKYNRLMEIAAEAPTLRYGRH